MKSRLGNEIMLAGALTAAPARPGAIRPTALVTPTRTPVARARRRADAERRPGGAPAPEARSRDAAIPDAEVEYDTGELPSLETGPWTRPIWARLGASGLAARHALVLGGRRDCGWRDVRRETGPWSGSGGAINAPEVCGNPHFPWKLPELLGGPSEVPTAQESLNWRVDARSS